MKELVLEFDTVNITLNEYIFVERGNKFNAASKKKKLTNAYMIEAMQYRGIIDPNEKHNIDIEWNITTNHDPDNVHFGIKFILDGMVKAGIIKTDTQKHVGVVKHTVNKTKKYKIKVRLHAE